MTNIISEKTKIEAAKFWFNNPDTPKIRVAEKYGISHRTLNRAIDALLKTDSSPRVKAKRDEEQLDMFPDEVANAVTEFGLSDEDDYDFVDDEYDDEFDLELDFEAEPEVSFDEPEEINWKFVGTGTSLTLYRNSQYASIAKDQDDIGYANAVKACVEGDFQAAWDILNPAVAIESATYGAVNIVEGQVFLNGFHVSNNMADRLIEMLRSQDNRLESACKFFVNLMKLEDQEIVESLFDFIEHIGCELNADGTFTGYRAVRSDYLDKHSGKISNAVGETPVMPRHLIDRNRNVSCSRGLHVGSLGYAKYFASTGDRIVKVVVRPEDVVSVPFDYNGQKMRTCSFTVIEDVTDNV